jgi:predicted ester cyclase
MEYDNKTIVREYIEKVINTGDVSLVGAFVSPDYVEVFDNIVYHVGIEGAKDHIAGVRNTYPDLELSIEKQLAEGDWVVTCYTMRGTHSGLWMNIKPTGKKIEVTGVNIDKVVNGKIVEHGGAANLFHAFLDIGAIEIVDSTVNKSKE